MKLLSVLLTVYMMLFFIVIPVGVLTVWFDFLLLPIPWFVAWIICGIIFALGIYIFMLSKREFDHSRQSLHKKTSKLVTSGIYSSIRNPHNLASVLFTFTIVIGFKSVIGLIIAIVSIVIGYWFTLEEEKLLIQQYGDAYRKYRSEVPMFIPKLRKKS